MEVTVIGGDIETAIRYLKNIVAKDGIHGEVKCRLAFVKPSIRRKAKGIVALQRRLKNERKREWKERHGRRSF